MDELMSPAQRRARHAEWLASFGLSAEDWRRIHLLASEVTDTHTPPALKDLSVPLTVVALPVNPRYRANKLGVITRADGRKVAIGYYRMDDHERGMWEARHRRDDQTPTVGQ